MDERLGPDLHDERRDDRPSADQRLTGRQRRELRQVRCREVVGGLLDEPLVLN